MVSPLGDEIEHREFRPNQYFMILGHALNQEADPWCRNIQLLHDQTDASAACQTEKAVRAMLIFTASTLAGPEHRHTVIIGSGKLSACLRRKPRWSFCPAVALKSQLSSDIE